MVMRYGASIAENYVNVNYRELRDVSSQSGRRLAFSDLVIGAPVAGFEPRASCESHF